MDNSGYGSTIDAYETTLNEAYFLEEIIILLEDILNKLPKDSEEAIALKNVISRSRFQQQKVQNRFKNMNLMFRLDMFSDKILSSL